MKIVAKPLSELVYVIAIIIGNQGMAEYWRQSVLNFVLGEET